MNRNHFWRTLWPFYSNKKAKKSTKIIVSENSKTISDDREIAQVFGNYFNSITQLIEIPDYKPPDDKYTLLDNPIEKLSKTQAAPEHFKD